MGGAVTKQSYKPGDEVYYSDSYGNRLEAKILEAFVDERDKKKRVKLKLEDGTQVTVNLSTDGYRLEKRKSVNSAAQGKAKGSKSSHSESREVLSPRSNSSSGDDSSAVEEDESNIYCLDKFKSKYTKEITFKWREAKIVSINQDGGSKKDFKVRVHFKNWSSKYDLNLRLAKDSERLAPLGMLSKEQIKNGEKLEGSKKEKAKGLIRKKVRTLYEKRHSNESSLEQDVFSYSDASSDNTDAFRSERGSMSTRSRKSEADSWASLDLPYQVGDTVDVLDYYKSSTSSQLKQKWRPAEIIKSSQSRVRIHFIGWPAKWDEDIEGKEIKARLRPSQKTSPRMSGRSSMQETFSDEQFREEMIKKGLEVYEVEADGNCLFRAVSHQCYQDQEQHGDLRRRTADHMYKHKDRFKVFVTEDFKDYIKHIRQLAVWGDDLEIRALEEILDRPIFIYSPEDPKLEPMNIHFDELEMLESVDPIKLSYHGQSHYNSVIDLQNPLPRAERATKLILNMRKKQASKPLPIKSGEAKESESPRIYRRKQK